MRILLIEDNPGDARLIQTLLNETSGDSIVHVAERLELGLQFLSGQAVDIVVLDLGLPDSWGLDTLTKLQTRCPRLPVVILTGSNDEALGVQALQLGAQDYLVKGQVEGRLLQRALTYAVERKRAEVALQESEERFSKAFHFSPVGINLFHLVDGHSVDVNDAYLDLVGYAREEVIDHTAADLNLLISPPEYAAWLQRLREQGAVENLDVQIRQKSGQVVNALFSIVNIELQGEAVGLVLAIDITERKRAEQRIQELNRDLQRRAVELHAANQELESFSYTVSHDLRTPLVAMENFARLLADECGEQLPVQGQLYLRLVRDNTTAMTRLIEGLLSLSRSTRQPLKKETTRPDEMVRQVVEELCSAQEKRPREIVIGDLPACEADPVLFKQVWVNLLSNALKFTRHRDTPRIEIGYRLIDGQGAYFVKDNGAGFDSSQAAKLFGVFQRFHTEDEFEGTGVGLAIVDRIIHRHGGRVWAEAEVNKGATFYFTLG